MPRRVCSNCWWGGNHERRGAGVAQRQQEIWQGRDHSLGKFASVSWRAPGLDRAEWRRKIDAVQPDFRPLCAQRRRYSAEWQKYRRPDAVSDQSAGPGAQLSDYPDFSAVERSGKCTRIAAVAARLSVCILAAAAWIG